MGVQKRIKMTELKMAPCNIVHGHEFTYSRMRNNVSANGHQGNTKRHSVMQRPLHLAAGRGVRQRLRKRRRSAFSCERAGRQTQILSPVAACSSVRSERYRVWEAVSRIWSGNVMRKTRRVERSNVLYCVLIILKRNKFSYKHSD